MPIQDGERCTQTTIHSIYNVEMTTLILPAESSDVDGLIPACRRQLVSILQRPSQAVQEFSMASIGSDDRIADLLVRIRRPSVKK